jgi:hypothetical protein
MSKTTIIRSFSESGQEARLALALSRADRKRE